VNTTQHKAVVAYLDARNRSRNVEVYTFCAFATVIFAFVFGTYWAAFHATPNLLKKEAGIAWLAMKVKVMTEHPGLQGDELVKAADRETEKFAQGLLDGFGPAFMLSADAEGYEHRVIYTVVDAAQKKAVAQPEVRYIRAMYMDDWRAVQELAANGGASPTDWAFMSRYGPQIEYRAFANRQIPWYAQLWI
jgi:hypothetical protein